MIISCGECQHLEESSMQSEIKMWKFILGHFLGGKSEQQKQKYSTLGQLVLKSPNAVEGGVYLMSPVKGKGKGKSCARAEGICFSSSDSERCYSSYDAGEKSPCCVSVSTSS